MHILFSGLRLGVQNGERYVFLISQMSVIKLIKEDIRRYREIGGRVLTNPTLVIILLYRLCHRIHEIRFAPLRKLLGLLVVPFYNIHSLLLGIELPRAARIGAGLRIWHFGCIVVHPGVMMGANCTLRHGVTLGSKQGGWDVPVCGDCVDFGAGCKVLGNIRIGNNVTIGANAVVLCDVPDNSIAVGVPAKIVPKKLPQ